MGTRLYSFFYKDYSCKINLFFICWMAVMAIPVLIHGDMTYTPWFVVYMFISFTVLFAITGWWQHYLDKGKK